MIPRPGQHGGRNAHPASIAKIRLNSFKWMGDPTRNRLMAMVRRAKMIPSLTEDLLGKVEREIERLRPKSEEEISK